MSNSCNPVDCSPPWDSPDKNTGVGCHSLLQRIFPTRGSNPCLLRWQADSLPLSRQRSLLPTHKHFWHALSDEECICFYFMLPGMELRDFPSWSVAQAGVRTSPHTAQNLLPLVSMALPLLNHLPRKFCSDGMVLCMAPSCGRGGQRALGN